MQNNLRYIKFNQLMASVESDLSSFADNNIIDRGKLIKVIRKVNADIGLKINKEKETIIDIKNFKGELPADFMILQLALGCNVAHFYVGPPSFGTETIEHNEPVEVFHNSTNACLNECGGCYWVTQRFKDKMVKYERLFPLKLSKRSKDYCAENCMNLHWDNSGYDIDIDYENDQIITPFREGKIYISYLADMVDDDGNILILDHPLVNDFYEYSVMKKLLENWLLNNDITGDVGVAQKLGYIKQELREARTMAINFIDTPEYSEIFETYNNNRKRFYNKYQRMFDDNLY